MRAVSRMDKPRTAAVRRAKREVERLRLTIDRDQRRGDKPAERRWHEGDRCLRGQARRSACHEAGARVAGPLESWSSRRAIARDEFWVAQHRGAADQTPRRAVQIATAAKIDGSMDTESSVPFTRRTLPRSAAAAARASTSTVAGDSSPYPAAYEHHRRERRGSDQRGDVQDSARVEDAPLVAGRLALSLERGIPFACRQFPIEESSYEGSAQGLVGAVTCSVLRRVGASLFRGSRHGNGPVEDQGMLTAVA